MKSVSFQSICQRVITDISDGNIDDRFSSQIEVKNSLTILAKKLETDPSKFIQVEQVHATRVVRAGAKDQGKFIKNADGMITNQNGVWLMLRLADCFPVFLVDTKHHAIGLVHSGWKGTVGKIVLVGIQQMMREFNSKVADIHLHIGPGIQKCCLSLDSFALELIPEWTPFMKKRDRSSFVDLPGFISETAQSAGVFKKNIIIEKQCSAENPNYFSHRRTQQTKENPGRFAALISLK